MVKKVLFINRLHPASIIPELLVTAGHDVHEAYDMLSASQMLEGLHYDLVILAENPKAEIRAECREIRHQTDAPLIVIGPEASPETSVQTINAGADFFIRKAFGPMELMARTNALLNRAQARQPVPVMP